MPRVKQLNGEWWVEQGKDPPPWMREYYKRKVLLRRMDPQERLYLSGFLDALLYAQAHNDVEGGAQILETHLPDDWWDGKEWRKIEDIEKKLDAIRQDLDDGGITWMEFATVKSPHDGPKYDVRVLRLAGTEGFHGIPEED